ncbi:MAG TPA: choice-of-anchor D domain-containing protein, partial [Thermoanaerobaculia bacterium]|nr:choice-of-anchor D domain-containing protein [Thermoanaerobaculia bacterium]
EEKKRRERRGGAVVAMLAIVAALVVLALPRTPPKPTPPQLAPTPEALTFPTQPVGIPSAAQVVRLRNDGDGALSISSLASSDDAFRLTHDCTAALAKGDSCNATIVFAPPAPGPRRGDLTIATNAGTRKIALIGDAQAPTLAAVDLGPLDLGSVAINTARQPRSLHFVNSGAAAVTFGAPTISAPFVVATNGCREVPPGGTCDVQVMLPSDVVGSFPGQLRLIDTRGNVVAFSALSGATTNAIGPLPTPAKLEATPAELVFRTQPIGTTSAAQAIQLRNDGDEPLSIGKITAKGDAFRVSNDCTKPLARNDSCSASVVFAPPAAGRYNGAVAIDSNGGTATIALDGEAPATAVIVLPPTDFGRTLLGVPVEHVVSLVNRGPATIAIGKSTANAPFEVSSDGCRNAKVAPGSNCAVRVQFRPAAGGPASGELSLFGARGETVAKGTLHGTGFKPSPAHLSAAPDALVFPQQTPGTVSDARLVQLRNDGGEPMTIQTIAARGEAFRVTSRCGDSLAPNESCSLAVAFAPRDSGKQGGTLAILTTGGNATVQLGGEGAPTQIGLIPPTDFGRTFIGAPVERIARFVNSGPAPVVIGKAVVPQPFAIVADGCRNVTLGPGRGCLVRLQFRPAAAGNMKGQLLLVDPRGNVVAAGALYGIGMSQSLGQLPPTGFPKIEIRPREINFQGQPGKATIDVTNVGTVPVKLAVKPETETRYVIDARQCNGVSLPPGKRCTIFVDGTTARALGQKTRVAISYAGRIDFVPVFPK